MRFAQRLNPHPRVESVSLRTERTRGVAWRDARSFCFGAVWPLKTPEQISYKVRRRFEHEIVLTPCVACVIKPRDSIDQTPTHLYTCTSSTFSPQLSSTASHHRRRARSSLLENFSTRRSCRSRARPWRPTTGASMRKPRRLRDGC